MNKFIKYGWYLLVITPLVLAFVVFVNNGYKLDNKGNNLVVGALINSSKDSGCFTLDEVPENNKYISYKYDGNCYINIFYSQKALVIEKILAKSYDSFYESRRYFDSEITKLHKASKDVKFIWYPDDNTVFDSAIKINNEYQFTIDTGRSQIVITWPKEYFNMLREDLYTKTQIITDGKIFSERTYKEHYFSQIYKLEIRDSTYYLLGLYSGGMHGTGIIIPIVYSYTKNELTIGKDIKDVDLSNGLRKEDFFSKNGELYVVIDDPRYFFSYSDSNNASYNSAVPRIFEFKKETADLVLSVNNFNDLYKKATEKIKKDLYSLKNNLSSEIRPVMMNGFTGKSLIPYFDYYLGMAIIADPTYSSETRKKVEKLYIDFYGEKYSPEAHFSGYEDYVNNDYKLDKQICPDDYVDWDIAVTALSQHFKNLAKENPDIDFGPAEIERHFEENCEEDLKIYNEYITKNPE